MQLLTTYSNEETSDVAILRESRNKLPSFILFVTSSQGEVFSSFYRLALSVNEKPSEPISVGFHQSCPVAFSP